MDYYTVDDLEEISKWDEEHKKESMEYEEYIMLTNERV